MATIKIVLNFNESPPVTPVFNGTYNFFNFYGLRIITDYSSNTFNFIAISMTSS